MYPELMYSRLKEVADKLLHAYTAEVLEEDLTPCQKQQLTAAAAVAAQQRSQPTNVQAGHACWTPCNYRTDRSCPRQILAHCFCTLVPRRVKLIQSKLLRTGIIQSVCLHLTRSRVTGGQ